MNSYRPAPCIVRGPVMPAPLPPTTPPRSASAVAGYYAPARGAR